MEQTTILNDNLFVNEEDMKNIHNLLAHRKLTKIRKTRDSYEEDINEAIKKSEEIYKNVDSNKNYTVELYNLRKNNPASSSEVDKYNSEFSEFLATLPLNESEELSFIDSQIEKRLTLGKEESLKEEDLLKVFSEVEKIDVRNVKQELGGFFTNINSFKKEQEVEKTEEVIIEPEKAEEKVDFTIIEQPTPEIIEPTVVNEVKSAPRHEVIGIKKYEPKVHVEKTVSNEEPSASAFGNFTKPNNDLGFDLEFNPVAPTSSFSTHKIADTNFMLSDLEQDEPVAVETTKLDDSPSEEEPLDNLAISENELNNAFNLFEENLTSEIKEEIIEEVIEDKIIEEAPIKEEEIIKEELIKEPSLSNSFIPLDENFQNAINSIEEPVAVEEAPVLEEKAPVKEEVAPEVTPLVMPAGHSLTMLADYVYENSAAWEVIYNMNKDLFDSKLPLGAKIEDYIENTDLFEGLSIMFPLTYDPSSISHKPNIEESHGFSKAA